jgi:large conductance mechanosensitive channel
MIMGLMKEFRDFAMRGNVVDMAVGIVIGAGFGKIVTALVEKIVMPVVGMIGGIDLSKYDVQLKAAVMDGEKVAKPAVNLGVGTFMTTILDFIIVAFAIFMVIKIMNTVKAKFEKQQAAAPPPGPSDEVKLLMEIRDSLKQR